MVFPHCLLNDLPLLHACNKAVVDTERYTVPVRKVSKYSSFFCARRILSHSPDASETVSADVVICVKAYNAWCNAVKKVLCINYLKLFF